MDTHPQLPESQLPTLTLVTAGTGKTGRRIIQRLTDRGLPVRVGSRAGDPPFDWADRSTWKAALAGVDAAYLAYLPDIGAPQAADDIAAFADLATDLEVQRVVLLSGRNEPMAQRCEEVLQERPWQWTVLRSSVFNQDFSEAFWLEPVRSGVVEVPAGEHIAEPFVDIEDVVDVAVAALTEQGHAGQIYELSGPRSVPLAEATAEIAAAIGRPVRYQPTTPEQYVAAMTDAGVAADEAQFVADLFAALFDGRNAATTDGVQRALGREPREFRDFVRETAGTGFWDLDHQG
ncbi:NmrA family transcriptional regulator [Kribbella sp. CA-294648]|uniref:NmrA family transcriptional regulator n=1 Tax=Kribbella sp. CA-294648 TaxID=3239948 RepID=UPI003D91814E